MRGTQLHAGGQDTYVVYFYINSDVGEVVSGSASATSVTTTTETALGLSNPATGGGTLRLSHWTAPWPCSVSEVFVEAAFVGTDATSFRLRRHDVAAITTADDVIRNANSGSATDGIFINGTAATYARKRYVGIPQDTSVAPYFAITTASSDTATGFLRSERVLAAGDRLSATYKMSAAGDQVSHVRCIVTLAKLDSI